MNKPKAYVSETKKKEVKELAALMEKYPIIGIVDLMNLPAPQYQRMRQQLKEIMLIKASKGRLIKIALDMVKSKPKLEELKNHIDGMPAIIFTELDPFKLFKKLNENKSSAPAKEGQKAPNNIVIPAGPTSFAPGPIISELGSLGIKTSIDQGKIVINEDKVVAKEGDIIDAKTASLLTRMNIEPMEVGLNLKAVYENGTIFTKSVLDIDEKQYIDQIKQASVESKGLAIGIGYACKDTIKDLIKKAYLESRTISDERDILTNENASRLITKAEKQASALKSKTE